MARAETHPDVEFAVDDAEGEQRIFKTFDEAAGFAISIALSNGRTAHVDVLIWNEKGARWYGGDGALEQYEEAPETSVFADPAGFAASAALSDGRTVRFDVRIWTRRGARWYGGDGALEQREETPKRAASSGTRSALT